MFYFNSFCFLCLEKIIPLLIVSLVLRIKISIPHGINNNRLIITIYESINIFFTEKIRLNDCQETVLFHQFLLSLWLAPSFVMQLSIKIKMIHIIELVHIRKSARCIRKCPKLLLIISAVCIHIAPIWQRGTLPGLIKACKRIKIC